MTLEPTERDFIREVIRDELKMPQKAVVNKVFEHTSPDDDSNFEANVELVNAEQEYRRVPIAVDASGDVMTPKEDDLVLLQFLDGDGQHPIITDMLYDGENRPPIGKEGMIRRKRGDLYFEIAPDGSWGRLARKNSDDAEADVAIEIDGSDINITTSGSINLGSPSGSTKALARTGDTVTGTTSDGTSFEGTIDQGSSDVNST